MPARDFSCLFSEKKKMARSVEFWLQLHRNFNPHEVLVGRRSDDFYCEWDDSSFSDLLDTFGSSMRVSQPRQVFLTGQRGSGISSLLLRLLNNLDNYSFPVYFDVGHNLNLDSNDVNRVDVLFLLGAAIQKAATDEGLSPDPDNLEALAKSVYRVSRLTKNGDQGRQRLTAAARSVVSFGESALKDEAKFVKARLALPAFHSGVSGKAAQKRGNEPQIREVIDNINLILADVETLAGKPVFVIADGLNKLSRQEQVENIFFDNPALHQPICHMIYTAPLSILINHKFCLSNNIYFFPNFTPGRRGNESYRCSSERHLKEVTARRLNTLGLKTEQLFEPKALDLLISKSGGLIRLFLSLVKNSGKQAELMEIDRISVEAARQAIDSHSAQLTLRLNRKIVTELCKLRQEKRLPAPDLSPEILNSQLIVAHKSASIRFDAHPIIYDEVFGQTLAQQV